jgi:hypothetical protein
MDATRGAGPARSTTVASVEAKPYSLTTWLSETAMSSRRGTGRAARRLQCDNGTAYRGIAQGPGPKHTDIVPARSPPVGDVA